MQRKKQRKVSVYTEPQSWRHAGSALKNVKGHISHLTWKGSQRRPGPWVARGAVSMLGANLFPMSGVGRWQC